MRAPDRALDVLRGVFGFDDFRPGQLEIIEAVLAGSDCIGVMPTGAGKSLTYQLPARILDGTVLVVSPLISLMKDQVDALRGWGFEAAEINSTLSFEERRERLRRLRSGEYELVYLAPEALDGKLRDFVEGCPIALLVVDEAHCTASADGTGGPRDDSIHLPPHTLPDTLRMPPKGVSQNTGVLLCAVSSPQRSGS